MRRALAIAALALLAVPASAAAQFGFLPGSEGFAVRAIADGAGPATQAGSHPYQLELDLGFRQSGGLPDGDLRDLGIELPAGMILNPGAVAKCPASSFNTPRSSPFAPSRSGESCPDRTQIGTVEVQTSHAGGETRRFGIFNLVPPPGVAAQVGFAPYGAPVVFDVDLWADEKGRYAIALAARNFPQRLDLSRIEMALWGVPWGASHDGERGNCLNETEPGFPWAKCSVGHPTPNEPLAYVTMPAACSPTLPFAARARSWQQAREASAQALGRDLAGEPLAIEDCSTLDFAPEPRGLLGTVKASSPSGYTFALGNDNTGLVKRSGRAPVPARRVVVRLPDGVSVNPSVGAGLGVCRPGEYAREAAFSAPGAGCPNAAKIGEFSVRTPLFSEQLAGAIYLAAPDDSATGARGAENPFDSLIAIYLVARSPARGVIVKVAGEVRADPGDGALTATFDELPHLPYADLKADLRTGQRAFLVSPPACGAARSRIEMTSWVGDRATAVSDSPIEAGIDLGPCPDGSLPPFSPAILAGGVNSNVGSYTPYFVRLSRRDTEQEITSYSLVLPKGITGRLAGIPFCPEAAIAAARGRRGFDEIAAPSCPAASQVGRTETGYGVGPALTYAPGRIYLAGPYNGQPLSLVTINAATVGPFDLGTIVVRSAFAVDETTAQLRIDSGASDPIPHIVGGIPLHLREVRIHIDRPRFTRNPTGCEAAELSSTLTGSGARFEDPGDDSVAIATSHFQLLNCLELGFRPRLGLRLKGGVRRGAHPGLRVVLRARAGDASMKRIAVTMPRSLFLAQNHLRGICTRVQFAAERCPANSVYGRAVVHTDLLDEPLRGPVHLRSSDNRLPDLVATLRSGEVKIVLSGRIGPSKSGGIRAFFTDIPDAPIERFVMHLRGGKRGLLVNSVNICNSPPKARVKSLAQNNRGVVFTTKLRGKCAKFKQKQRQRRKQKQRRGRAR
ncbi:MAG: hypothetical protein WDZ46_09755 [Solirubrobacterales bacterium]